MKYFTLALVVIAFAGACASMQSVDDTTIVKIVDTGRDKAAAFDLSMRWLSESFRSAKAVIEYSDKDVGTINGKGTMTIKGGFGIPIDLNFAIIIDVKDKRSRLTFRALSTHYQQSTSTSISPMVFEQFQFETDNLEVNYQKYLTQANTNW